MNTPNDLKSKAVYLILEGHTQVAIADALNVTPRTIRRWVKEPDFAADATCDSEGDNFITRIQRHVATKKHIEADMLALNFLKQVMCSETVSLTPRMRAAQQILNNSHKWAAHLQREELAEAARAAKLHEPKNLPQVPKAAAEPHTTGHKTGPAAPPPPTETPAKPAANATPEQALAETVLSQATLQCIPELAPKADKKRTSEERKKLSDPHFFMHIAATAADTH